MSSTTPTSQAKSASPTNDWIDGTRTASWLVTEQPQASQTFYDERYPCWVRLIALFFVFLVGFLLWRGAIELLFI
jgi:hypothetical protein